MRKIKLTRNKACLVDEKDFDKLNKFKWYAAKMGDLYYAYRTKRVGKRSENKKFSIAMHREVLNVKKGLYVDHINGNTLDNRRSNLRHCSNQQNSFNHKGQKRQRKYSKYKGVKKNTKCNTWSARITVSGKAIYLGSFKTENEAAIAYNNAALEHFGNFCYLNEV